MADESTEIFDDLYLGLRAGGALRKRRRKQLHAGRAVERERRNGRRRHFVQPELPMPAERLLFQQPARLGGRRELGVLGRDR